MEGHSHHKTMMKKFKQRFFVSTALTAPILLLSPFIQRILGYSLTFPGKALALFFLSTAVYVYGGSIFLTGMARELKTRSPGMMTLIGMAITIAYVYSGLALFVIPGKVFFWELATLIDIMLLGHWIEMKSVLAASRALEEIVKLLPSKAHLIRDGAVVDVPIEELKPGDIILIKPGEKIPVDGVVLDGFTEVNEAMLTGEARPVPKERGEGVIAGSINGGGSITVKVEKKGAETYLAQIIELVKKAQETKSKVQGLADRASKILTITALIVGAITFLSWLFFIGDPAFSLERAVTVMVITCPHALGLAIPLVVAVSTSIGAKKGILIRNRNAFESARNLQAIIFDKTGTLTKGAFEIAEIISFGAEEDEILTLAASLESKSEHPIAQGIIKAAEERGLTLRNVENFRSLTGKGVEGVVDGRILKIVGHGYLKEMRPEVLNDQRIERNMRLGRTIIFLLRDSNIIGAIALGDVIRPESKEAIKELKKMGMRCMMLTGDNKGVAEWVAKELGLDEYFAEVLPHEKMEVVRRLQEKGLKVAMVGDGVNDAPALIQADVGIAIGAGTDVAVESADIILVRNDPRDVTNLLKLARSTYRKMIQNLLWAAGYNFITIPLAAGILYWAGIILSPAIGALIMSISTVIVAINAKLLKL